MRMSPRRLVHLSDVSWCFVQPDQKGQTEKDLIAMKEWMMMGEKA